MLAAQGSLQGICELHLRTLTTTPNVFSNTRHNLRSWIFQRVIEAHKLGEHHVGSYMV